MSVDPAAIPLQPSKQELVYAQVNQEILLPGDTLWVNLMVLRTEDLTPSPLSRLIYCEVWGPEGVAILKARYALKESMASVAIPIPNSIASGFVLFRAYTRGMRHGSSDYFSHKWIRIINPELPPPISDTAALPIEWEATIEGGRCVLGQPSFLHVLSRGWNGIPLSRPFALVNNEADTILTGRTNEQGVYKAEWIPLDTGLYTIQVSDGKASEKTIPLGKVESSGFTLSIIKDQGEDYIVIASGPEQGQISMKLEGWRQGIQVGEKEFVASAGAELRIPFADFVKQPGLYVIQLKNPFSEVLNQRIYLQDQPVRDQGLTITSPGSSDGYAIISLSESMLEEEEKGRSWLIHANPRSMSVKPANEGLFSQTGAIAKHFGPFLPPGEFLNDSYVHVSAENLGPGSEYVEPESRGMILSGRVTGATVDFPTEVYFSAPGDPAWVKRTMTDEEGTFTFLIEPLLGQPETIILRLGQEERSGKIEVDPSFESPPDITSWPSLSVTKAEREILERRFRSQQLDQRYLAPPTLPNDSANSLPASIYGKPDHVYFFRDYTAMPTRDAFIEFIPQASIRTTNGKEEIYLLDKQLNRLFQQPPLMLIDGVPVWEASDVFSLRYSFVEKIELVTRPFLLNGHVFGGVLHLVTTLGDGSSVRLNDGELRVNLIMMSDPGACHVQRLEGDLVPTAFTKGVHVVTKTETSEIRTQLPDNQMSWEELEWSVQVLSDSGWIWRYKQDF